MATSVMTLALSGLVFLLLCGLSSCSGFGKHKLYSGSKGNDTNLAAEEASFFLGNDSSTPSPLASHFARVLLKIKASFQDTDNALYDWINGSTNGHNDYCTWRGVLCNNVTIVKLNLSHLNLGGEISPMIGHLKRLELLDLEGNALFGRIPNEIGDIFALKCLNLAQNQLSGKIPRNIYWNEVLEVIVLQQNLLVGTLSPDMCQLTRLQLFDVGRNNLTGTIPDNMGDCRSLNVLDLSYNQLTGVIPLNNRFPQLNTLALQGNKLTGRIPEAIGLMRLLIILDLSDNYLTGTIPPILGNLDETLVLVLFGNSLTGSIPTELGNMRNLKYLYLEDNQLTGQIPPEMGKLENLIQLDLSRNQLEGSIPENISSCISLNYFNVKNNNLNGTIPHEFQKLERLTYFDLSSNNMNGMIHAALQLTSLETLNLSRNNLSGIIPAEIRNLINIMDIDLSFNRLSGPIPQELGELHNLVSLILNNNNLSGEVPLELTNCIILTTLNLSNNDLSGNIPTINNFTRFTSESFFGNPDLCGKWTGSHCGIYSKQSKGYISTTVIVCISLGSMIIFCATMIALYYANRLFCGIRIAFQCANQLNPFIKGSKRKMEDCPRLIIFHMDMVGYTYGDMMRSTENLNDRYIIGYGATSNVYKCVLRNNKTIAIKRLHIQNPENVHAFETELKTAGNIKHSNLVSLLGYSLCPHGNLLFYDYMANGSLWDILHGSSNRIQWNTRLRIALGAAKGLAYLHHDCNPHIIHRDVKSSNILLDENFEARLADFGIAKCIPSVETHTCTYVMGTIGYIDPEYGRTFRLNEKSDVYSYGIVLLELMARRKAVDNDSNLLQLIQSKGDGRIMDFVDPEVVETCTDITVIRKVMELALFCSREQPSDRPTMIEVVKFLQKCSQS